MKKLLQKLVANFKAWQNKRRYKIAVWRAAKIIARTKAKWPGCEGAMMADVWPPTSGATTGYVAKGKTTILWGTEGLLASPIPAAGFYTVIRFSQKQIVDRTKLPNGNGVTSSDVFVTDGSTWEITVRDDTQMTPPLVNTTISVVDAQGLLGNVGLVYSARIVDSGWESAPKQAGERTLMADNLLLIDSQNGTGQTAR